MDNNTIMLDLVEILIDEGINKVSLSEDRLSLSFLLNNGSIITKKIEGIPSAEDNSYSIEEINNDIDKLNILLSNRINEINEKLDKGIGEYVNVKYFVCDDGKFVKGDGIHDDSSGIQKAINYVANESQVKTVYFPEGTYLAEGLQGYSGIRLLGAGRYNTKLKRINDKSIMEFKGDSILNPKGKGHLKAFTIERLYVHTCDKLATPALSIINCDSFRISDCFIIGKGAQLLLWECFDSRITNTDFEWGGDDSGNSIGVELRSTNGGKADFESLEYTNQIYFDGCRFESYRGVALKTTGANTNEINIANCKFESIDTRNSHIVFENAVSINMINVQLCLGLKAVDNPIIFKNINNSKIDINFEIAGSEKDALVVSPIYIGGSNEFSSVNNNFMIRTPIMKKSNYSNIDYAIILDKINDSKNTLDFKCSNNLSTAQLSRNIRKSYKNISGLEIIPDNLAEPYILMKRGDSTDLYYLGRIVTEDNGTEFRLLKNETNIMSINKNSQIIFNSLVKMKSDLVLANLTSYPTNVSKGSLSILTINNISTFIFGTGVNQKHQIGWNKEYPKNGQWDKGTIIFNSEPQYGENIGWICITSGIPGVWKGFGKIVDE